VVFGFNGSDVLFESVDGHLNLGFFSKTEEDAAYDEVAMGGVA
jgi:hypothetical protein